MGDIPTASMFNVVPPPNRPKIKANPPSAKTIKTSGAIRVGQACDRCRAKKTKCDGKLPTCSSCAAVGFKCIVSDKLSRRAFPKGYTETLEERIRQLEAENKKLVGLIDLRDEQISMLNSELPEANVKQEEEKHDIETPQSTSATPSSTNPLVQGLASATASARVLASVEAGSSDLTSSNLSLLESRNNDTLHSHRHDHHDGVPCSCSDFPNMAIHEGPVSVSGSIFDENLHSKQSVSIPGSIILSDNEDNDSLLSFDDMDLCDDRYDHNNRKHRRHSHNNRGRNGTRDVSPAPGAFAAATAIAHMQKLRQHPVSVGITGSNNRGNEQQLLTQLVAISIPRLTEETLVIPTLLAKVCQVYGYSSKPAILTANAIASLKESATDTTKKNILEYYTSDSYKLLVSLIINRYDLVNKLPNTEASFFIHNLLNLPPSRIDLDHLITIYFQDWGNMLPILDKNVFLKDYIKFLEFLDTPISSNNDTSNASTSSSSSSYELIEKFGAILILILSLSILSTKSSLPANNKKYLSYLQNFDYLIREFVKPNCIITKTCSIQSLQILTLSLQYCLVTGDISTCYELRGRVITMGQQLRLHRCPAAVLGIGGGGSDNDVHLQNFRQGERRILFWCIYSLDVYSSLSLGVPRLLKDFEIECAIPFSGKDGDGGDDDTSTDNVNILVVNNTPLSIVGKVSKFCLSVMLYSKVLANILDSIFSRYESGDQSSKTLSRERMLDTWRRELPKDLKFEIDVNGLTLINNKDHTLSLLDGNIWKNYSNQQLTLIFLYYHAKILIYLPVISKHGNEHHNVGLSQKEQLFKPKGILVPMLYP